MEVYISFKFIMWTPRTLWVIAVEHSLPHWFSWMLTKQLFQWQPRLHDISPAKEWALFSTSDLSSNAKCSREISTSKSARKNWKNAFKKIITTQDHNTILSSFGNHIYFCFNYQEQLKCYILCSQWKKYFQIRIHVYPKFSYQSYFRNCSHKTVVKLVSRNRWRKGSNRTLSDFQDSFKN